MPRAHWALWLATACATTSLGLACASAGALTLAADGATREFMGAREPDTGWWAIPLIPTYVALGVLACVVARRPLFGGWRGARQRRLQRHNSRVGSGRMVVASLGVCGLCWLWAGERLGRTSELEHNQAAWWSLVGVITAATLAWAGTIAFHLWWRAIRPEPPPLPPV